MTADEFNAAHPIGTPVQYWPGARKHFDGRESVTRTLAWSFKGGPVMVSVVGYPGGIALTHIEVLEPDVSEPTP